MVVADGKGNRKIKGDGRVRMKTEQAIEFMEYCHTLNCGNDPQMGFGNKFLEVKILLEQGEKYKNIFIENLQQKYLQKENNKLEEEIDTWWAKLSQEGKKEIAENLGYIKNPNEVWESLDYKIRLDIFKEENNCRP